MATSKPSNPKDIIGSNKLPLHLWPSTATAMGCMAFLEGALKYGRSNFREVGVRASIYKDALDRHMTAWFEGEDIDPESGLPHLGKALACIAILVDAQAAGKLNDDRMIKGGWDKTVKDLTPHVARLKELHADVGVKHYTIKDNTLPFSQDIDQRLQKACDDIDTIYPKSLEGFNTDGWRYITKSEWLDTLIERTKPTLANLAVRQQMADQVLSAYARPITKTYEDDEALEEPEPYLHGV